MHLHFLLNTGIELSGTGFFIAVAILACLLGVMVAGIFILISKMSRARREKQEIEAEDRNSSRNYYYGVVVMLGAIPQTTYVALSILAGLVAVAAVVFTVMLIMLRKKGYTFISAKDAKALATAERSPKEEPMQSSVVLPADTEEQRQEAYTEPEESALSENAFSVFEENSEMPASDAVYEDLYEEENSQEDPTEDLQGEVLMAPVNADPVSSSQFSDSEDPTFADGTRPYKIVEKIVTETQKEVVREVPAAPSQSSAATEQLMEKLTDFLDYELQKRKESDLAQAAEADGTVATFSQKDLSFEDEELDDEDEIEEDDLDDAEDVKSDEEDDIDDEEPDGEDRFTGNERIIGFDENTGCYIVAHYRKSFEAKLIQARPRIKQYYSELKNALLAYKGTKSRISWTADSFHNGRTQIAKINVKTNILELYLALDPETLDGTVYRGKNVGSKKKYSDTPFLYKLRTPRKFKWAMELVQRTCEEHGLSPIDIEKIDYAPLYPFESTESLVSRKLIKEYIREEKPATTFELAPDHVPSVPDEDESVIPANANFSWEFDNEMLERKKEESEETAEEIEEPEIEASQEDEESEETAIPEESVEPASNVVKETVKITEMRYTERYYANADPSYEQIITTQEAILPDENALTDDPDFEDPSNEQSFESDNLDSDTISADAVEDYQEDAVFEEEIQESEDVFVEEEPEEFFFDESPDWTSAEDVYVEEQAEEFSEEEYAAEGAEEYAEEEYTEGSEEYAEEEYAEGAEEYAEEEYAEGAEEYAEEEYAEDAEAYVTEDYEETSYEEIIEKVPEEQPRRVPPKPQHALDPTVAVIDICSVAEFFNEGDTVNLETLKAKGLVIPAAKTLKIYSGGTLEKRLAVEAHHFSLEAIFAIGTVGGETSMLY